MVLPMNDGWYALPQVTGWLNDPRFYHGTFGQWFWHYARYTTLVPLAFGIFAVSIRMCRDGDAEHLRGLRLLRPRRHNHQLNGGWRGKIRRGIHRASYIDPPSWAPVRLGSSIIPHDKECEHFLVTGSPGAGKSTLIRQMLLQIEQRGQTAIVIDPECEFVRQFYNERRGDVVLNPLDARCPFWSPWLELRDDSFAMDAEALAASLIRGQPHNSSAQFFQESSRTLVESIFQLLKEEQEPRGIATFLAQPRNEIHQALAGTRAYPLVDPQAHEQGAGILATAANAVKPFHHLPAAGQTARPWSAREWAQTRKGWVFLCSTEDARAAIQKLQGVWLDSLVRWLMSADIGSDQVWIIADELASLEYQPQIEKLVTRGRKRGMATVLGFQNVSQLRSIYGRDGAITLTSSPTTKVILRCDEAETAKWASELIGSREIERLSMTALTGLSTYREGMNLSPRRSTEHIVTAAEVQLLKPFSGYLCVAGYDRTAIKIPKLHLEAKYPAFVPRAEATAARPKTQTANRGWRP